MKKFLKISLMVALALCFTLAFTACNKKKIVVFDNDGKSVIITASETVMEITESTSLHDYMNALKEKGELDFDADIGAYGAQIKAINGVTAKVTEFWALYTSDSDNENTEWGTCEYNDKTYGSATLGASDLIIKSGELYIWVLQGF